MNKLSLSLSLSLSLARYLCEKLSTTATLYPTYPSFIIIAYPGVSCEGVKVPLDKVSGHSVSSAAQQLSCAFALITSCFMSRPGRGTYLTFGLSAHQNIIPCHHIPCTIHDIEDTYCSNSSLPAKHSTKSTGTGTADC